MTKKPRLTPSQLAGLRRASATLRQDPYYFSGLLETYRQREGLTEAQLAETLGCAAADLPLLALCRRPASDPAGFRADVTNIAQRFKLDAAQLAHLTRAALSYETLANPQAPERLLAARDHAEPEPPEPLSPSQ